MTTERNVRVTQGNQVRLLFALSVRGLGRWNFAAATSVLLELEDEDGVVLTPVASSSGDPESDWAHGMAAVLLPSTYTEVEQSLRYSLTVSIGDEVKTVITGTIFVEKRAGYTPP